VDEVVLDGKAASLVGGDSVNLSGKTEPIVVRFKVKKSQTANSPVPGK
jgi:hypothetical protein